MSPLLFAWLFSVPAFAVSPAAANPVADRVGAVVEQYRRRRMVSGTLLVRYQGQELEWDIDLADDRTRVGNGRQVVSLIASLSKSFVSAAILKLAENHRLSTDDTLHSWIPEYPEAELRGPDGTEVTLKSLLTHTSGVPEAYLIPDLENRIDRVPVSFADILAAITSTPLGFSPGSRYEYSNTGYLLLGEVVHRASGTSYHEFLQKSFFLPLGLSHTSVGPPADPEVTVARSYERETIGRADVRDKYGLSSVAASDLFADTNIYTTPTDLAVWTKSVTSGGALSASSTSAMLTPHLNDYGYGWFIFTDGKGRKVFEHAGDDAGYQSWARRYPDEDTMVIWLSNQGMAMDQLSGFIEAVSGAVSGAVTLPR